MLIHRITHLPHEGLNSAKEFGGKTGEKELVEHMKKYYELVKKARGYSILSINNPTIQLATQILAGNVMRKSCIEEVSTPIVSLVGQCVKGILFNWSRYLCQEFLTNFCKAQDETKPFHYAWLLISIVLVSWELLEDRQFPLLEKILLEAAQFVSLWAMKDHVCVL